MITTVFRICVLGVVLAVADFDPVDDVQGQVDGHDDDGCGAELLRNTVGFLVTLCVTVTLETAVAVVAMRGSILNVQPRSIMPSLLYARLGSFSDYSGLYLSGGQGV